MEIGKYSEKVMEKSVNFSTGCHHKSRTRSSNNSMFAVVWLWEAFGLCSRFQIVVLDSVQTIFSAPCFQFEKRFDFLLVYFCEEYAR